MGCRTKCYACDAASTGRTKHNGEVKPACTRHRDPRYAGVRLFATISKSPTACIYCGSETRRGSIAIHGYDGNDYAHAGCAAREDAR